MTTTAKTQPAPSREAPTQRSPGRKPGDNQPLTIFSREAAAYDQALLHYAAASRLN